MNKLSQLFLALPFVFGLVACNSESIEYKISITNPSELNRESETIEIPFSQLAGLSGENTDHVNITDHTGKKLRTQLVDLNSDSIADYLVFQADFKARETRQYTLWPQSGTEAVLEDSIASFCRFVPERIDDFAWENDRVAFRTYGPTCQQMFEAGTPGGLISSGIDCWLKRVDYPIIDRWYTKNSTGGSYHEDTGEGLDNYHVGTSRGCGGTAIVSNDTFVLSKNFQHWEIIANGPIRSVFKLTYPTYLAGGFPVREHKTFTIDLGTNFYHCELTYDCTASIEEAAIGIAHHNKEGEVSFSETEGCLSYWEPQDDSFLGSAIILDSGSLSKNRPKIITDADNHWITLKPVGNSFGYRAGFGWEKSGRFSSPSEWKEFVHKHTRLEQKPLILQIEKL